MADKLIPAVLAALGVVLAALYVLATSPIGSGQDAAMAVFTAIIQGVLCAAGAVYANQCVKQKNKSE